MQMKFWNTYRSISVILCAIMISACGNEKNIELQSGNYIPNNIEIIFNDPVIDSSSLEIQQLRDRIYKALQESFFTFKMPAMDYVIEGEKYHGIITPENLALSNLATFHITPLKDGSIEVISQDYAECQQVTCELRFLLSKTTLSENIAVENLANDEESLSIEHKENERATSNKAPLELPNISTLLDTKFWGVEHEISDQLSLKLSPAQSNGLIYGIPEYTDLTEFTIAGIAIDPTDSDIEILSFYQNAEPSSEIQKIDSFTYLFILPQNEAHSFDISQLTGDSENVLFENEQHLLISENNGFYAVYYRYFPDIQKSVIALTESPQLEDILQQMQALETLKFIENITEKSDSKNNNNPKASTAKKEEDREDKDSRIAKMHELNHTIVLTDITLPLKTIESRYQISLNQMFRINDIEQFYQNEVQRILSSEDLFLKTGNHIHNGYHQLTQYLGDYRFNETYVKLHPQTLDNVITTIQALNNHEEDDLPKTSKEIDVKGLWNAPIYVYSKDSATASGISYLKEIQPGITLEIFSPAFQGHIAEKVLFAKLLEQLSWKNIPKIPTKSIPNIAQYTAIDTGSPEGEREPTADIQLSRESDSFIQPLESRKTYHFKEGETDLQGNLI